MARNDPYFIKRNEQRNEQRRGTKERGTLTWPTHAAGGIATLWMLTLAPGAGTGQLITAQNVGSLVVIAATSALLPDLDAQHSKIRSLALGPLKPLDPLGALIYAAWGHRGPLHSLPGLTVFGVIAALPLAFAFGWIYGAAALLGYGSHLALDAMTRHGVPLLPTRGRDKSGRDGQWGFRRRYYLLPPRLRFVTGSEPESVLQMLLLSLSLLLLVKNLAG